MRRAAKPLWRNPACVLSAALLLLLALLRGAVAQGQAVPDEKLPLPPTEEHQKIIDAVEVPEGQMPAVVRIIKKVANKYQLKCTGTLIGPRVLLTAAHCVSETYVPAGGRLLVWNKERERGKGDLINAKCTQHPGFAVNVTADFALCLLETDILSMGYEWVSDSSGLLYNAFRIHIVGYGCTQAARRNVALVDEKIVLGQGFTRPFGYALAFAGYGNVDNFVALTQDVKLQYFCSGDSGGPAFLNLTDRGEVINRATEVGRIRVIAGVNAGLTTVVRSNISLMGATSSGDFGDFLDAWQDANRGVSVCRYGLADPRAMRHCRSLK